ncbi:unnamed protein product [Paramecium octaurelia]|uniref:Oxidoreductase FAD/NAD(P)-binding domain-containing protein n=1 Tax=Paramecium octaurelia TaxID=43137 RepID=A0A8S1S630_PAROT|nr:unnamed protein product [Paramecium octaurelia]
MSPYPIKLYHRWGNFILWGILVDVGIIYASCNKCQRRTNIHGNIMTFVVINSFLASLAYCYLKPYNYSYDNYSKLNDYKQIHLVIGTALMLMMIVLSSFGYFVKYQLGNSEGNKNVIYYKKIHSALGQITYLIAKLESFIGMFMSYRTQDWFIYICITYLVVILCRIAFEWVIPAFKSTKIEDISEEQQKLITYESLSENLENKQWFIFQNQVYCLDQNYIHPGGQIIWKHIKHIEISQYFYGITQLPGTNILHYHSKYAKEQFNGHYYGTLCNQITFPNNPNTKWELKNQNKVTDTVSYFQFQHPEIEFEINLKKITPNHFVFKSITDKKVPTRLYTYIQCMQKPALEYMQSLSDLYDKIENVRFTNNFKSTSLSFLIKYYNTPHGFSKYITKQNPEMIDLQGPYQTMFKDYLIEGQIILICGGTGILPFLDLLNYHLLMCYNELIQHPNLIKVASLNRYITLFYSVTAEEELLGDSIFLKLREIQNHLKKQNFSLILKCRKQMEKCETTRNRFTRDFIEKQFKFDTKQIFVCGPQILRNSIYKEFKDMQNEIIYL